MPSNPGIPLFIYILVDMIIQKAYASNCLHH